MSDGAETPGWNQDPEAIAAQRSPGVNPNTVWIWIVALLPLGSTLLSLTIPWGTLAHVEGGADDPSALLRSQMAVFLSPQLWLVAIGGYVLTGLGVYLAYLDHRRLRALGVQKPFHWAFAFLGVVYPLGRSIIVRQRTGRGLAPLWVTIAAYLVALAVSTVESVILVNALITGMGPLFSYLHDLSQIVGTG